MQADRADRDRPAVRVVRGIANVLVIRGDRPLFRGMPGVVGFDDILGPVVVQPAVAMMKPTPPCARKLRWSPER